MKNTKLLELLEKGRAIIKHRKDDFAPCSSDFMDGFKEGVAEGITILTGESAFNVLCLLCIDTFENNSKAEITADVNLSKYGYKLGGQYKNCSMPRKQIICALNKQGVRRVVFCRDDRDDINDFNERIDNVDSSFWIHEDEWAKFDKDDLDKQMKEGKP